MHLETIVKKTPDNNNKKRKTTDRVPITTTTTMGSVAPNAKTVGDLDKGMIKALRYINFAVILSRCSSTSPPGPHPKDDWLQLYTPKFKVHKTSFPHNGRCSRQRRVGCFARDNIPLYLHADGSNKHAFNFKSPCVFNTRMFIETSACVSSLYIYQTTDRLLCACIIQL